MNGPPDHVRLASVTFKRQYLAQMLSSGSIIVHDGHWEYPVSVGELVGMHIPRLCCIEGIAKNPVHISWIVEDIVIWLNTYSLFNQVHCIFAPAQEGVKQIVEALAVRLGKAYALWSYDASSGRFAEPTGDPSLDFADGYLMQDERVLVFNGVTQQGRCVGERLQDFARHYSAKPVALAVVAKGTSGRIRQIERQWDSKFYATIQVDGIEVYEPEACPLCANGSLTLVPWTQALKNT